MAEKVDILIVDDESLFRDYLKEIVTRMGFNADEAVNGKEAIEKIKEKEYDIIITDIRMPEVTGMDVLKEAKSLQPNAEVLMITAFGTIENAVEAMKIGAFDYITKESSLDHIEIIIKKAIDYYSLKNENRYLRSEITGQYGFDQIVGKSAKMQKIFDTLRTVSASDATVFIQGPSGTGKELIARAIHYNSNRRNNPFIKTNCAALPEGLMESELFGHEKGAFTGAIRTRKGRFEAADTGTLLLDEVSEMSPALQAKLLRVLQEKEFERVGDTNSIKVNVRIIATTNKEIKEEIKQNNFRLDLYYRINVIPIYVPPLRERKKDIPLLVDHFIQKYNKEHN
ncbi:sigma-54-dependent Fis family transcriptional regulator, partial [bacterium]|nr:sigma-54-dependent Fis family transcriptional regulator [bacterium]